MLGGLTGVEGGRTASEAWTGLTGVVGGLTGREVRRLGRRSDRSGRRSDRSGLEQQAVLCLPVIVPLAFFSRETD